MNLEMCSVSSSFTGLKAGRDRMQDNPTKVERTDWWINFLKNLLAILFSNRQQQSREEDAFVQSTAVKETEEEEEEEELTKGNRDYSHDDIKYSNYPQGCHCDLLDAFLESGHTSLTLDTTPECKDSH